MPTATNVLDPVDYQAPEPPRRPWVKLLLISVCALIALMWVYAFVFAPDKGVYRVDSNSWRKQAEIICSNATAQRVALADTSAGYIAHPTQAQMIQRADVVDKSTDIVERMLNQVVAVPVASQRDSELIATFEKYYRIIINDRRAYTESLRKFVLTPYQETSADGGPVTNIVTDFTSGNDIKDCVPPGELGGDF
jgi:hypothetical protein